VNEQPAAGPLAGSGRGRYLISAGDPALLREIAGRVTSGGGRVVRTIGAGPDVLVVEADAAAVRRLNTDFPGGLEIETDERLPEPGPAQPPGSFRHTRP
jgi:hypothetical protein